LGGGAAWVGRVVRAARNPSERGVRHGADARRGELRPDAGPGLDVWTLA
jgi:hypothetical protein